MSVKLPKPGTKAWIKAMERALKTPNFKVKAYTVELQPRGTKQETEQIKKARDFLINHEGVTNE